MLAPLGSTLALLGLAAAPLGLTLAPLLSSLAQLELNTSGEWDRSHKNLAALGFKVTQVSRLFLRNVTPQSIGRVRILN